MWMTEGEIRRAYRTAKNQRLQIKVLAQLNGCGEKRIARILGVDLNSLGGDEEGHWNANQVKTLLNMRSKGHTFAEIADKIDKSEGACCAKWRRLQGRVDRR